jgi:hypothetical protein
MAAPGNLKDASRLPSTIQAAIHVGSAYDYAECVLMLYSDHMGII